MLAKRPESVSLNWSLQSRAKRAIEKNFFSVENNSIRKDKEVESFMNQENSHLFPESSPLLQRHKEVGVCRLEGSAHFHKLRTGDSLRLEGSGIDRKGRRSGY